MRGLTNPEGLVELVIGMLDEVDGVESGMLEEE